VPELRIDAGPLRFVFPHAPIRPVTINMGMSMRAWFDVLGLDRGSQQDENGIRKAEGQVRALIHRENERGMATERIVLAGFSQGGSLALHTGLRYPERLAGLIGLSTYLPLSETIDAEAHEANRSTPIFMAHGTLDPLVSPALGTATRDFLGERDYSVEWHSYAMGHAVCAEQVAHIRDWMSQVFSAGP
jgi:phospholipase/carboxylesterase